MATSVQLGTVIDGKYRVIRHIGEGGMGTVYEGQNVRIERRVAIKVLHEHVASSPDFAQRFEREARASARIGSPHVCDVLDLGDLANGERFIVMEYLEGESFEDRITKVGRLTPAQLAPIAFEILEGLGSMHQVGVIHRDLKPANVFLAKRQGNSRLETVKILDFGVAKIVPRADEPSDMTSTGMMMGTPLYMSPEQARGARDVDGRTDLYAASVMFYRALTGEMPHSALNLHELLFKIVLEEPKPIRMHNPEVDEHFAAVIQKGLARDADHRYLSAREYQQAIAEWGNAQGRASLQFAVTMSSEPPPLRNISGGFPASALRAQNTGPVLPRTGPPTPALAASVDPVRTSVSQGQGQGQGQQPMMQPHQGTGPGLPVGQQQQHQQRQPPQPSGGTPIVWSEDAPEAVKRAYRELEAQKAAAAAAGMAAGGGVRTQAFDHQRPPQQQQITPFNPAAPTPTPMPPRQQSQLGMKIGIGLGALVFISAAAVVGTKLATSRGGGPVTGNTGTTPTVSVPEPSTSPSTTTSSETPPVVDTASAPTPSASVSVAVTPTATMKWVPPPTRTAATNTAPSGTPTVATVTPTASPPTATTAPTPTPTTTTSGRRFRTNL